MHGSRLISLLLVSCLACAAVRAEDSLPAYIDNSINRWFPPVINQTGGSCAQASYIGYMFTYEINRLLDRDASVPENRFAYLYTWNFVNEGIDQGSFGLDGIRLALTNGIMPEHLFPAQSYAGAFRWASGYDKYLEAMHYKAKRVQTLAVTSREGVENAKKWLAGGGVMTFSGHSGGWTITSYSGPSGTGYNRIITTLPTSGSHAMTIVGYDDSVEFTAPDGETSTGAFIMCNTWGEYWCDRGRVYYPYWFFLSSRDQSDLSYEMATAEVEVCEPQVVFRVSVECDSRDDLAFKMGVADGRSKKTPMHDYTVSIANHAGGDHPMQGSSQSGRIEFGFDFTPYVERMQGMSDPKFFLTVQRNKRGSQAATYARLLDFGVYDYRTGTARYWDGGIESPAELSSGDNIFSVATSAHDSCSYNPVQWLLPDGSPSGSPMVIKAADGTVYKAMFENYDRQSGTIRLRYKQID